MKMDRRRFVQRAAVGISAVVVGACTGLAPSASSAPSSSSASTSRKRGTTLTVASSDFAGELFDPVISVSFDRQLSAMFDAPLRVDADGRIVPGIVKSWESSPDKTTWTMHLRDDVVFHDGSKVTADDLAYSYQRSVADNANNRGLWIPILGKEPKIDVVNPTTIVIHTVGPQPLIIPQSTNLDGGVWVVPKTYIEKNGQKYFNESPIGTGPWKFESYSRSSKIVMSAVPYKHWRVDPQFEQLVVRLIPDASTAIAELRSGGVDAVSVSPQQAESLRSAGFKTAEMSDKQFYLTIVGAYTDDVKGKPLSDVRVRQALSLVINRQELLDSIMKGKGSLPGPIRVALEMADMTPQLRSKWGAWAKENFRYDVARAKQLLSDAGYPNGFTLDFWNQGSNPDSPYLPDLGQGIASYWQKIGINVNISSVTNAVYGQSGNPSTSKAGINKVLIGSSDMAKPAAVYNLGKVFASGNPFANIYASPEQARFDKLFAQGYQSTDDAARAQALDDMLQIAGDSWTGIPIVNVPGIIGYGKRVRVVTSKLTFHPGDTYADWEFTGEG